MRTLIFLLIIGFGIYSNITVNRMKKIYEEKYQLQLQLDQALMKLLNDFLPICSVCKKVNVKPANKDAMDAWEDIDSYVAHNTDVKFSHGYC